MTIRPLVVVILLAPAGGAAQEPARATVTIEQRVALGRDLTPQAARRRALEEAMAEAVRQVVGVKVHSTAVATAHEAGGEVTSAWRSVVQLDAAGRAVDVAVLTEGWDADLRGEPVYRARIAVTVEREVGTPDAGFTLALSLPAREYRAPSADLRRNDELVPVLESSHAASVALFSLVGDSATALLPHPLTGPVTVPAGTPVELPDPAWRARGLRLRVTPVSERRDALLVAVAVRGAAPPRFEGNSLLAFQQWLVRIPLNNRAVAFAPYVVVPR